MDLEQPSSGFLNEFNTILRVNQGRRLDTNSSLPYKHQSLMRLMTSLHIMYSTALKYFCTYKLRYSGGIMTFAFSLKKPKKMSLVFI